MSHTTKLHAETVMGLEQQTLWKRMSKSKKEELDRFQTSMVSKLQHIIYICVVYGLTINNETKDKPESTPIQSADSEINSKDRDEDQPEPEQQPETEYEATDLNPSWPDNAEDGEPASSEEGAEFARTIRNLHSKQITTARVGTADNVSDIYTKPVKTGVWRALYLKAKGYESPWRPDTETATQHQWDWALSWGERGTALHIDRTP